MGQPGARSTNSALAPGGGGGSWDCGAGEPKTGRPERRLEERSAEELSGHWVVTHEQQNGARGRGKARPVGARRGRRSDSVGTPAWGGAEEPAEVYGRSWVQEHGRVEEELRKGGG